jgi:hypothetical protein
MRRLGLCAALMALWALGGCGGAASGEVARACLASGRQAANPTLCSCVQGAANATLTSGEQRRAAAFLGDPGAAQAARLSNRRGDELFWQRYQAFADRAEASCG